MMTTTQQLVVFRAVWTDTTLEKAMAEFCEGCDAELLPDEGGCLWVRPLSENAESGIGLLEAYCSVECVDAAIEEWAAKFKVGYVVERRRLGDK